MAGQQSRKNTSIDYGELFDRFCNDLTKQEENDSRIRLLARQEADDRIATWLFLLAFVGVISWKGWQGALVVAGAAIIYGFMRSRDQSRRVGGESHLIPNQAEDFIRLSIIAETFKAGEVTWSVHEAEFKHDEKSIVAAENERWDGAWERIYHTACEFRHLSPLARRRRLEEAAKSAEQALLAGEGFAKTKDTKLTSWAARALQDLRQKAK